VYTLTIFGESRQCIKTIETFEPPNPKLIEAEVAKVPGGWYDISRRELEPEDYDYRDENQTL
jgi:hypothetical protein